MRFSVKDTLKTGSNGSQEEMPLSGFLARFPLRLRGTTSFLSLGYYDALEQKSWFFDLSKEPLSRLLPPEIQYAVYLHELSSHPGFLRRYRMFFYGLTKRDNAWNELSRWLIRESKPLIEIVPALEWADFVLSSNETEDEFLHLSMRVFLTLLETCKAKDSAFVMENVLDLTDIFFPKLSEDKRVRFAFDVLDLISKFNCLVKGREDCDFVVPQVILEELWNGIGIDTKANRASVPKVNSLRDALDFLAHRLVDVGYRTFFTSQMAPGLWPVLIDVSVMMQGADPVLGFKNLLADSGIGFNVYVVDPVETIVQENMSPFDFFATMGNSSHIREESLPWQIQNRLYEKLSSKNMLQRGVKVCRPFPSPLVRVTGPYEAGETFIKEISSIIKAVSEKYDKFGKTARTEWAEDIKSWEKGWFEIDRMDTRSKTSGYINYYTLRAFGISDVLEDFDEHNFEREAMDIVASFVEEDNLQVQYDKMKGRIEEEAKKLNQFL